MGNCALETNEEKKGTEGSEEKRGVDCDMLRSRLQVDDR